MSTRFYARTRQRGYREPPAYRPGEILMMVGGCAVLAVTAFLVFSAFAG